MSQLFGLEESLPGTANNNEPIYATYPITLRLTITVTEVTDLRMYNVG